MIEMSDKPTAALRSKPNSSMVVGLRLQTEGRSDAFISAGNTGAQGIGRVDCPAQAARGPNEAGDRDAVPDGQTTDRRARLRRERGLLRAGAACSSRDYDPCVGRSARSTRRR